MTNLTIDLTKPGYRLPTKEEWIWAYKAGTTTPFYWGNLAPDNFAWFSGNGGSMTHPVGLKTPNANGLYDMAGNVMEWLNLENPSGSTMASAKGGGYNNTQPYLDHNAIWSAPTSFMNPWAGFRVARNYVNMQPIYLLLAD
jgi:formylglycine-generating enzyme required for sulfatase activity